MSGIVHIVVGGQYGSEGKGHLAGKVAQRMLNHEHDTPLDS